MIFVVLQNADEFGMLLALPCGHDHVDIIVQSRTLEIGFITYLQQKQAAGIVNVALPGSPQVSPSRYCMLSSSFPNVAALMDLLYISRSSAVCPTIQTLAPILPHILLPRPFWSSSVSFGLPVFILVLIYPVFGIFLCVRNNLIFAF